MIKFRYKTDILRGISKALLVYGIYGAMTFPAALLIRNSGIEKKYVQGFWTEELYCISSFLFSLIFLFSLMSIFTLADKRFCDSFAEKCKGELLLLAKIKFIFKSSVFWMESLFISLLIVLFPYITPFSEFLYGFFGDLELTFVQGNLVIYAITIPLLFFLNFFANLSTVNWWHRMASKRSLGKVKVSIPKLLFQLLYTTSAYLLTAATLCIVIPMFYTLFSVIKFIIVGFLTAVVLIIAAIIVIKYGRSFIARRSFMKKLKKICDACRYKISNVSSVYKSVIFSIAGSNFKLSTDKEIYECKLICCNQKKKLLYFNERGEVFYNNDVLGIIKHITSYEYKFEAAAHIGREIKKVLIVVPEAKDLFATDDITDRKIYSGDTVMEYKVFQSSAFLGFAERRCL